MPQNRQLTLHEPKQSGDKPLLVRRIEGSEGLSELFAYEVSLFSKNDDVKPVDVLGRTMCVGLFQPGNREEERFFHGFVARFACTGSDGEYTTYRAVLRPDLWRLTLGTNCRIFQGKSAPEIVIQILKEYHLDLEEAALGNSNRKTDYLPREYCVQYRETDFAFVSRLLEQEGIHYFFRHTKNSHTLILADSNFDSESHRRIEGYQEIAYSTSANMANRRSGEGGTPPELIWDLRADSAVLSDRVTLGDYDFSKPNSKDSLKADSGSDTKRADVANRSESYEVYDYLESVVVQTGYSDQLVNDYCRIRAEELHVRHFVSSAQTDARGLCAGALFKLKNGPKLAGKNSFMVVRTELRAELDVRRSSASGSDEPVYHCRFEAVTDATAFRPARVTPKPIIAGPQSATVVGSEQIAVDSWGRIQVMFHWARHGENSCKVRVSQNSAGASWGSMFLPHRGQEVLVSFLEGDPDRPVVIGRVYNGANEPPLTLPAEKEKSIFRDHAGNQIIFDGTQGKEKILIQSPLNHSALQIGDNGIRTFSRKKQGSFTWDTESYQFGHRISYTKGWSWSVDRGYWASVKAGAGIEVTVGLDVKASIGPRVDIKTGPALSFQREQSISVGYSYELKMTKGSYRRIAGKDAFLDAKENTYVAGGNDNALFAATPHELTLSFDDGSADRHASIEAIERCAVGDMAKVMGFSVLAGMAGGAWYQKDVSAMGTPHPKLGDESTQELEAEYGKISQISTSDATGLVLLGRSLVINKPKSPDAPSHPSPTSKVRLAKDFVEIFAGKSATGAKLELSLDHGIVLDGKTKRIAAVADAGISMISQGEITLHGKLVQVRGELKHNNLRVMSK